jgi:hypothetical protein
MSGKNKPGYHYNYYKEQREALLWYLGDKCVRCGIADHRVLQFDHIYGDANTDPWTYRKSNGSTGMTHRWYQYKDIAKMGTKKYQILCANCNWIKRYERKEHGKH